ncbi:S-layer homology domain-containing protein [Paenibacillus sp. FSL H7-0331]
MYFDDVPQHAWYAQAVVAAVEAGLITGRTKRIFARFMQYRVNNK